MSRITAAQELLKRDVPLQLLEAADVKIFTFDAASLRLISANQKARRYLGGDFRVLRNQPFSTLFPTVSGRRATRIAAALRRRGKAIQLGLLRRPDPQGNYFTVSLLFHDAERPSISLLMRNMTRFVQARQDAEKTRDMFRSAIETLPDGFAIYDADDRLALCNQTYRNFFKLSAPVLKEGNRFADIIQFGIEAGEYPEAVGKEELWFNRRMAAHNADDIDFEERITEGRWLRVIERRMPDGSRVGLRSDITTLKTQQAELVRIALTDDLTGLRNRRDLPQEIADIAATLLPEERLALVHMDIDRFKGINDTYGQCAGDLVLKTCARRLLDTPIRPELVARVDGDGFVLALRTTKTDEALRQDFQTLQDTLAAPILLQTDTCEISTSLGAAFVTQGDADHAQTAIEAADIAVNIAKRDPKRGAVLFETVMREASSRSTRMVQDIKDGLAHGEFRPYFQPQVDARTGRTIGLEALIRWERKDAPPVPAYEFLSVAQDAGLTEQLDAIVMRESCKALKQLRAWGMVSPCISLNISMVQIRDNHFADQLARCVAEFGVQHDWLRLELLESTLLDDRSDNIIANVNRLIDAGFQVELDDFGTGHAAVATLRKFPVSRIKIDRSFVRSIDTDKELQTITRAIVDLAQNLNISVLAEGVETEAEQKVLLDFHCDAAQGYLYAAAMPLKELRSFLMSRGDIPTGTPDRSKLH